MRTLKLPAYKAPDPDQEVIALAGPALVAIVAGKSTARPYRPGEFVEAGAVRVRAGKYYIAKHSTRLPYFVPSDWLPAPTTYKQAERDDDGGPPEAEEVLQYEELYDTENRRTELVETRRDGSRWRTRFAYRHDGSCMISTSVRIEDNA